MKFKRFFSLIFILLLLFPAVYPLVRNGFFHFSDEPSISLIYEMSRGLRYFHIPVRWIPDVAYNFGHPLFNFYYVLPFYLGSFIFLITGSLISSIKIYFLLTVFTSFLGMYLFLKKHTTNYMSLMGAIIYVYTPYRAVDLYVRGAIGELTVFALAPFVCLLIYKIFKKASFRNVSLLGVVTALFILSHNLAIMIFFPWFIAYAFYLVILSQKKKELIINFLKAALLGFGISLFWLLPAIVERSLLVQTTPFNYADHFPFIKQLIFSPFRYGASAPGPYDDISFQIGFANLILVLIAIWFTLKNKKNKLGYLAVFTLIGFFTSIFFMNIRSRFFWELFSLSNYFQFPWRILMITTFLTSFMIVFIKNKILATLLVVVAIASSVTYFRPSEYYYPNDDYFMRRFFADLDSSGKASPSTDYKNYSEDYLLLPKWVTEKPKILPKAKIESINSEIEIYDNNPFDIKASVFSESSSEVVINNFYFPGWKTYIDGKDTKADVLSPYGNMGLKVEKGEHKIRVVWNDTPLRKTANIISLFSLCIALFAIFAHRKLKYENKK